MNVSTENQLIFLDSGIDPESLDFSPAALARDGLRMIKDNQGYLMGAGLFGLRVLSQGSLASEVDQQGSEPNYHLLFNGLLYIGLPVIIGAGNARRVHAEFQSRMSSIDQNIASLREAHSQTGRLEGDKRKQIEARLQQFGVMKDRAEKASGGGAIVREFAEGAWATLVSIFTIANLNRIRKEYGTANDSASKMAFWIEGLTGIGVSLYFARLAWNTQGQGGTMEDKEKKLAQLLKQTGNN